MSRSRERPIQVFIYDPQTNRVVKESDHHRSATRSDARDAAGSRSTSPFCLSNSSSSQKKTFSPSQIILESSAFAAAGAIEKESSPALSLTLGTGKSKSKSKPISVSLSTLPRGISKTSSNWLSLGRASESRESSPALSLTLGTGKSIRKPILDSSSSQSKGKSKTSSDWLSLGYGSKKR